MILQYHCRWWYPVFIGIAGRLVVVTVAWTLFPSTTSTTTTTRSTTITMTRQQTLQDHRTTENSNDRPQNYPLMDPSIAKILCLEQQPTTTTTTTSTKRLRLDVTTRHFLTIHNNNNPHNNHHNDTSPLNMNDLIQLAIDSDECLLGTSTVHEPNSFPSTPHSSLLENSLLLLQKDPSTMTSGTSRPLHLLIALVLLNELEATLCRLVTSLETHQTTTTSTTPGRSPLLTTVLQQLEEQALPDDTNRPNDQITSLLQPLVPLLTALLLPTGLNLRNLVWHGFVASLPRPWVSLLLLVQQQLNHIMQQHTITLTVHTRASSNKIIKSPVPVLHPYLQQTIVPVGRQWHQQLVQNHNESNDDSWNSFTNWLPTEQHVQLWDFSLKLFQPTSTETDDDLITCRYPTLVSTILILLLEAGLRNDWCRCNPGYNQDCYSKALPKVMYVTLDGHGQRNQHNLVLQPYLLPHDNPNSTSTTTTILVKNALFDVLGPGCSALMMDLFVRPDGPNLRAAAAHGSWNHLLEQELNDLTNMKTTNAGDASSPALSEQQRIMNDVVHVLLATLECVCGRNTKFSYRPIYSYTATTSHTLQQVLYNLDQLCRIHETDKELIQTASLSLPIPTEVETLPEVHSLLEPKRNTILKQFPGRTDTSDWRWTVQDIFDELESDRRLAPLGATRSLLVDTHDATSVLIDKAQTALQDLTNANTMPSRQRKRLLRVVASSVVGFKFYSFATLIALQSLERALCGAKEKSADESDNLKAVQRTRMVVSTTRTFLTENTERALKAISEYAKGKAIKSVIADLSGNC